MASIDRKTTPFAGSHFDVIIVGAGISGITSAYRVQTEFPHYNYTILESRGGIGGTWDFFKYPGIRSDSDLHTFGFPWRPWTALQAIADGPSIRKYINESAEQYCIDKKIRFHHRLTSANWSSSNEQWNLVINTDDGTQILTARFVVFSTGYFSYEEPLHASIPNIDRFKGPTIHPQFWPQDLDYTGKKIVVIGSGATAITLVPTLAATAARVTMLQRSPTYILSLPFIDPIDHLIRNLLALSWAVKILRWKYLVTSYLLYQFCRTYPNAARWVLKQLAKRQLPGSVPYDPNFRPSYNPWEQRLCICPDADFYKSLGAGRADVVTDRIKNVTETSIETESGKTLETDIIVTATGLKLQFAGDAEISVDCKPIVFGDKFIWRGQMLQDVPNAVLVMGYNNASWTLGADATAIHFCRLLKHMDKNDISYATPRVPKGAKLEPRSIFDKKSTYMEEAKSNMPRAGNKGPWKPRRNYIQEIWRAAHGSVTTDIEFTTFSKKES
ncbi:hypothetical protein ACLOAV_004645 [Pseudogymnoascus australis]